MVEIRLANSNDAQTISRLAEQTWYLAYQDIISPEQIKFMLSELYAVEKIRSQISNSSQKYVLLMESDAVVAFAGFADRDEDPEILKLHKLYCLPQTQGKGYGKALINWVIQTAIAEGKAAVDLNVNRLNEARFFYLKMGFEILYQEDIPIGPFWMNDFIMRKQLVK